VSISADSLPATRARVRVAGVSVGPALAAGAHARILGHGRGFCREEGLPSQGLAFCLFCQRRPSHAPQGQRTLNAWRSWIRAHRLVLTHSFILHSFPVSCLPWCHGSLFAPTRRTRPTTLPPRLGLLVLVPSIMGDPSETLGVLKSPSSSTSPTSSTKEGVGKAEQLFPTISMPLEA